MLRCMCVMAPDIQFLSAELLLVLIVYDIPIGQALQIIRSEVRTCRQVILLLHRCHGASCITFLLIACITTAAIMAM